MGCDIHAAIEYKDKGVWRALLTPNKYYKKYDDEPETTASLNIDRDYNLFSILANVRNGSHYYDMGEEFNYISSERGLPKDITSKAEKTACTGDHSDTWVNLQEILDFDWSQVVTRRGVVDVVTFEEWDRCKEFWPVPKSYSGDVCGANIVHISEEEMRSYVNGIMKQARGEEYTSNLEILKNDNAWNSEKKRYTRVTWKQSYAECTKQIWTNLLPHMLPLGKKHGYNNVRLVMNFDS